jgi:hypothetical protein
MDALRRVFSLAENFQFLSFRVAAADRLLSQLSSRNTEFASISNQLLLTKITFG